MAKTSSTSGPTRIKVIGLGGGGGNAVSRMVRENIRGIEFIAMNTDAQALSLTEAPNHLLLGERLTRGLGVGGDSALGRKAAESSEDEIKDVLLGADMVFITAGMGGGTGTGAAPIVAKIAKQTGALTIAVVTKPFSFEGRHRNQVAEEGIARLLDKVDTLVIIPNDRLFALCDQKTSVDDAFILADDVLRQGVQAISEVITMPGLINLDFADIKAIMKDAGPAWMSVGIGSGQDRAITAAKAALASPLLDVSMEGAKGVLFNVVGGSNLTLFEVNEAARIIKGAVDAEANIIFGVAYDANMDKGIKITLMATGFVTKKSDEELIQFLSDLKRNEDKLDAPSFLRYPLFNTHRSNVAPVKVEETVNTMAS